MSASAAVVSQGAVPTQRESRTRSNRQLFTVEHLAKSSVTDAPLSPGCARDSSSPLQPDALDCSAKLTGFSIDQKDGKPSMLNSESVTPLSSKIKTALTVCDGLQNERSLAVQKSTKAAGEETAFEPSRASQEPGSVSAEKDSECVSAVNGQISEKSSNPLKRARNNSISSRKVKERSSHSSVNSPEAKSSKKKMDIVSGKEGHEKSSKTILPYSAARSSGENSCPRTHPSRHSTPTSSVTTSASNPDSSNAFSGAHSAKDRTAAAMLTPLPQFNTSPFSSPHLSFIGSTSSPHFPFMSTPLPSSPSGYESGDVSAFSFPPFPSSALGTSVNTPDRFSFLSPSELQQGVVVSSPYADTSSTTSRGVSARSAEHGIQKERSQKTSSVSKNVSAGCDIKAVELSQENVDSGIQDASSLREATADSVSLSLGNPRVTSDADTREKTCQPSPVPASGLLSSEKAVVPHISALWKGGRASPYPDSTTVATEPAVDSNRELHVTPPVSPVPLHPEQERQKQLYQSPKTSKVRGTKRRRPSSHKTSTPRKPDDASSCDSDSGTEESDSDTEDVLERKRKSRTCFTMAQLTEMEKVFSTNRYLSTARRAELAKKIDLHEKQVKTWFQNRRMKEKRLRKAEQDMRHSMPTGGMDLMQLHAYALQHLHQAPQSPFMAPPCPGQNRSVFGNAVAKDAPLLSREAQSRVDHSGLGPSIVPSPTTPSFGGPSPLGHPFPGSRSRDGTFVYPGIPPSSSLYGMPGFSALSSLSELGARLPTTSAFDFTSYELGRQHMIQELRKNTKPEFTRQTSEDSQHSQRQNSASSPSACEPPSDFSALQNSLSAAPPHPFSRHHPPPPLVSVPPYPGATASPFQPPATPCQGPGVLSNSFRAGDRSSNEGSSSQSLGHSSEAMGTRDLRDAAFINAASRSSLVPSASPDPAALSRPTPFYLPPRW